MHLDDLMRPGGGARWCEQHRRLECTRQRHHGRGDCHGSAIRGLDACRLHSGLTGVQARARGDVNLTLAALMSAAPPGILRKSCLTRCTRPIS
jgi:hypothetical protein